jgi:hypothetical protein
MKSGEHRPYLDLIIGFVVGVTVATWTADCRGGEPAADNVRFSTHVAACAEAVE